VTNVQLYFAIAVPTFAVLVGIVIAFFQNVQSFNQLNGRFTSFENRFESRLGVIESDLKTLVRVTNDLDVRLARVEERLAR
jgi:hypothetical protein